MAITRQVITSIRPDGTDMLGTKSLAVKIADESIVSGSLLTVESNHFCVLKSRGAVLNVYETGPYALTTPDKPLLGSIAQGFFGGNSPWVFEVIYINRSKLLIRSEGVATSEEMAEMAYQVDYYIHVDTKEAALDLITHLPFNGHVIDTKEVADYAGPAIEQAINQVVQVTKMEDINEHIGQVRELVKTHLSDFLRTYGITLNDLKILIMPKDERMRELISLQAIGLTPIEAVRYYLALRMAEKGLVSAPNAAAGLPFNIGGQPTGFYSVSTDTGLSGSPNREKLVPGFYDAGPLQQIAINLFYGWGYNFYRVENQLRADDQLIRSKAAWLLGLAAASLSVAENAYRREFLPRTLPRTSFSRRRRCRHRPGLERMGRDICALEASLHQLPAPENDRMTQRYRQEAQTLQTLINYDQSSSASATSCAPWLRTSPPPPSSTGSPKWKPASPPSAPPSKIARPSSSAPSPAKP